MLELEFYGEINKEESKFSNDGRNVVLNIKKKEKGPYWPRLLKTAGKHQWLNVDWTRYIDEDEEDEVNNDMKGNFNPMNLMGGMPGMGGMGGMPGMGGMDDMGGFGDGEGDEEDEDDKPSDHQHTDKCDHGTQGHEHQNTDKSILYFNLRRQFRRFRCRIRCK